MSTVNLVTCEFCTLPQKYPCASPRGGALECQPLDPPCCGWCPHRWKFCRWDLHASDQAPLCSVYRPNAAWPYVTDRNLKGKTLVGHFSLFSASEMTYIVSGGALWKGWWGKQKSWWGNSQKLCRSMLKKPWTINSHADPIKVKLQYRPLLNCHM